MDRFSIHEPEVTSVEGYRLIWYHSTRKAELDALARQQRIERALLRLAELRRSWPRRGRGIASGPRWPRRSRRSWARPGPRVRSRSRSRNGPRRRFASSGAGGPMPRRCM